MLSVVFLLYSMLYTALFSYQTLMFLFLTALWAGLTSCRGP